MRVRVAAALVGLVSIFLVVGCGGVDAPSSEKPVTGVFIGPVVGTKATIALVSDGKKLAGYLCDAKEVSVWLKQPVLKGPERAKLLSREGAALGSVTIASGGASGDIEIDGELHSFSASLAPDEAGLYHKAKGKPGEPGFTETGWIVLADGSVRGRTNLIDPANDLKMKPAGKVAGTLVTATPGVIDSLVNF